MVVVVVVAALALAVVVAVVLVDWFVLLGLVVGFVLFCRAGFCWW